MCILVQAQCVPSAVRVKGYMNSHLPSVDTLRDPWRGGGIQANQSLTPPTPVLWLFQKGPCERQSEGGSEGRSIRMNPVTSSLSASCVHGDLLQQTSRPPETDKMAATPNRIQTATLT
ncbi:hypothetical protein DPEC_G00108370 [Dallia pectoralis]|uniref:Uncharacterized protein n=1 Tax=Dallia pectoralis TaxID=75939 RepID=A0ACC2GSU6_DALPE|nr:hypothetical protein DPEC_G00108370 [Dallia pectoralis]